MYNSRCVNIQNRTGRQTIMGNGNQINIRSCQGFKLDVTGNGNQITVNSSKVVLNITGNGNNIVGQNANGDVFITGNGNNFSSSGGNLKLKTSNGNGNYSGGNMVGRNINSNQGFQVNPGMFMNGMSFFNSGNFMNQMSQIFGFAQPQNRPPNRARVQIDISSQQDNTSQQQSQISQQQSQPTYLPNNGLLEKDLNKLPKTLSKGDNQTPCTVCMQGFKLNQYQTFLFCFHKFHTQCIHQWLRKKSECPVCQMNVRQFL